MTSLGGSHGAQVSAQAYVPYVQGYVQGHVQGHSQSTPAAHETGTLLTRRLNVAIRGTLHQFANGGQEAACWTTQNGKINDIMGITELLDGTGDQASSTALLANALLHEVTVLETKNDFPLGVGVYLSCVPNKECTRTGNAYAFSCLPETTNSTPLVVYKNETSTGESAAWRQQYPDFNVNNLDSHGVLNVQGENFVFVSKAHPVIDLLRLNKDILNADIDTQPLIDDQWFKVTKQVMSTCCQQLKSKVLSKVGTCDLNQVSLQLSRLDGIHWVDMSENDELFSKIPAHLSAPAVRSEGASADAWQQEQMQRKEQFTAAANALLKQPYAFHARLELKFELMPTAV